MTFIPPVESNASLAGLRVAVTRSVDRAGGLINALTAAGAEPVMVPVIDFEISEPQEVSEALGRLAAGEYRWLVISSITTVRALKQACQAAGTTLAELIPAATSVATIGPTSLAVLAAEGIHAELAPIDLQSAAGLVELWPDIDPGDGGPSRVLLPQSNLAEATLVDGITAKGWAPEIVTAYKTVNYPADPELRLTATLESRAPERGLDSSDHREFPILTPTEAAQEIHAGAINAVVLASGSAARRVAETMAPLPQDCLLVAIGQPTRSEAQRLGMTMAATAEHPTPEGIVAALLRARTHIHQQ
ncbi:uroporphyrinogen-III synthase [Arthrobacter psychrolactophilus]|uniref:Uroporphyrinogen-III synthase n=1 Tax=Arthrobacter psychrolactophilus TaxID=92442 RepID=A0A2V5JD98_9MICC|nr:uroporphyrinogen-III synthase [Arthrobacter psychrolactophilus]PYI37137.1 uroporphyrinogen-III synthase [Arthrobacter psychrolactophilus]